MRFGYFALYFCKRFLLHLSLQQIPWYLAAPRFSTRAPVIFMTAPFHIFGAHDLTISSEFQKRFSVLHMALPPASICYKLLSSRMQSAAFDYLKKHKVQEQLEVRS